MQRMTFFPRSLRTGSGFVFEVLENRRLLALNAGDANEDGYVDEADIIQVMKFGKLESGEEATWEEGDWNHDGQFNSRDLAEAFISPYVHGVPYDSEAGQAVNQLSPLDVVGASDVTIFYLPERGDVIAIAPAGMTALHLASRSNSFVGNRGLGTFDVAAPDCQFVLGIGGRNWIEHQNLLPLGWSEQQLMDDLLVDGALVGGGGLGNVRLGAVVDLPSERPEDALVTAAKVPPSFVEIDEAHGLLTYDPQSGDILIEAVSASFLRVRLSSPAGFFTGARDSGERYLVHNVDRVSPEEFVRSASEFDIDRHVIRVLPPITTIYLPGIAQVGLSHDEFFAGVHPSGNANPSGELKLALEVGPLFSECEGHFADGALVGDANIDGQFNSQDLVLVFQAAEYEDGSSENSTWSEGDWTCDGDFDSADLVVAFQAGNYELPVAAIAARISGQREVAVAPNTDIEGTVRNPLRWQDQSDAGLKEIELALPGASIFKTRLAEPVVAGELVTDEVMRDAKFL